MEGMVDRRKGKKMDGREGVLLQMCESQRWPLATSASYSQADLAYKWRGSVNEGMVGSYTICASKTSLDGASDMKVPKPLCTTMGQASHGTLLNNICLLGLNLVH